MILYFILSFLGTIICWTVLGVTAWIFMWFTYWECEPTLFTKFDLSEKEAFVFTCLFGPFAWIAVFMIFRDDKDLEIKFHWPKSKGQRFLEKLES